MNLTKYDTKKDLLLQTTNRSLQYLIKTRGCFRGNKEFVLGRNVFS